MTKVKDKSNKIWT